MNVIFDTNPYRYLAAGRNMEQTTELVLDILIEERRWGIRSFAAPTVLLELFNHLEDENDPHFRECLGALVASYLHTHDLQKGVVPYMAQNVNMLNSQVIFGSWDSNEEAIVRQMDDIASIIFLDPRPEAAIIHKSKLKYYWEMARKEEQQFVITLNKMVDEYHKFYSDEKDVVKRLRGADATILISKVYAIGVAIKKGIKLEDLTPAWVEVNGQRLKNLFPAPFRLYVDIVSRFISNPKFDASKGSRRNWYWDFQMLFYITPQNDFTLITDDGDICEAAKAVGLSHKVKTLKEYLSSLNPVLTTKLDASVSKI